MNHGRDLRRKLAIRTYLTIKTQQNCTHRKILAVIMTDGWRHHLGSLQNVSIHQLIGTFYQRPHFNKYMAALSQWETAVIMSPITQSKSTIVCHGQLFLHVCQSVYSSASCRVNRMGSTYLQIFSSMVGWSSYSFALMQAHTLVHTCSNTLPYQK